jgi:hypothetical protein
MYSIALCWRKQKKTGQLWLDPHSLLPRNGVLSKWATSLGHPMWLCLLAPGGYRKAYYVLNAYISEEFKERHPDFQSI